MLVIFDVDDTLLETAPVAYEKSRRTAVQLGLSTLDIGSFRAAYGRLTFEQCLRSWHGDVDVVEYARVYDTLRDQVPYRSVPGALAVLGSLRASGHALAVLTNGPGRKTHTKLAEVGIPPQWLRFVRHSDNARHLKPETAAFTDLVADFGLTAASTVYVSDRPEDGVGAIAAGMRFVGLTTGVWDQSDFAEARLAGSPVCDRLVDVPGQLVAAVR